MREIEIIYKLVESGFDFGYYVYNVKYPYFHCVFGIKSDIYYYVHEHGSYCVRRDKTGIKQMLEIQGLSAQQFLRKYFPINLDDTDVVEDLLENIGDID